MDMAANATMKFASLQVISLEHSTGFWRKTQLRSARGQQPHEYVPELMVEVSGVINPKTGMSHGEMKLFVRRHFDEFVNRKNLEVADLNFAPEFVDHGSDVPPNLPP